MQVAEELTLTFLPLQVLHPVLDFLCDTLLPVLLFRGFFGSEVPEGVDVVEYPESSGTMRLNSSAMVMSNGAEKVWKFATEGPRVVFLRTCGSQYAFLKSSSFRCTLYDWTSSNVAGWPNLLTDLVSPYLAN